ncbi:sensor histidine kinase [Pseudobacteroides cellulosolvens]|uniref:histidine kinase n=1 Tax=Pseudobacteroides cellulosolvens ATCC 35603 = DSM 2933 TaxID=398512 RepID=A0A0L6JK25_9FIRM|nr:histidine kinase N-terminal 7TM domain-containing protein [Pseudobacteroides cellulosolvens]KNY26115.1 putative signal transduction histidine kinase [Pseudobacteroides cellulosolvens ATCC 35603 = DSM 2933]
MKSESLLLKNILLDIEVLSVLISLILLVVYWKRSEKNCFLICYTLYQVTVIFHTSSHVMKHLNQFLDLKEFYFACIKNISFTFAEITCLILFWVFANPQKKINKKLAPIFILPIIYSILTITNRWSGILAPIRVTQNDIRFGDKTNFCHAIEYTIWFTAIPLVFISLKKLVKMRGYKLIQGMLIFSALLIPSILYFIRMILNIDLLPSLEFDPVPAAMSISTILLAIAAIKYRLISLVPVAFKEFAESISTPFIVLDNNNRVQYYNNMFSRVFSFVYIKRECHIQQFFQQLKNYARDYTYIDTIEALSNTNNFTNINLEVCLFIPKETIYKVSLQEIRAYGNERVGKLMAFNDITYYKILARVQSELAATKTRIEISTEAHDVIGYAMTHIIMYLQEELSNLSEEEIKQRENTVKALKMAKEKNAEFREILYKGFNPNSANTEGQPENFKDKLMYRLKSIKEKLPSGINMVYSIDGQLTAIDEKYFNALDSICLEAINNSLKHGNARNIEVILKGSNSDLRLKIIDDGKGCMSVNKGIGLTSMTDRVNKLGGTLRFINEPEGGFGIFVNIPITTKRGNINGGLKVI